MAGVEGQIERTPERSHELSRRTLLKAAAAVAAGTVIGFDPLARRWVAAEEAWCSFDRVPPLDGELVFDAGARSEVATDKGNYVTRTPCAVLRPGSVADVAAMIAYCRKRKINVSARGQAHSTYGQSLTDGLVIDNTTLSAIHHIGADHAWVDTGCTWKALVEAAYAREPKLTPPVLTGYTQLSIGGTLSMGGIGGLVGGQHTGLQVDHVRALEVVTGKGDVVTCSLDKSRDLFEAVLGGLGQYGVMTKAKVDLVPAKDKARNHMFQYGRDQLTDLFADFRTLLDLPGFDHVYVVWMPPGQPYVAQINAVAFYDDVTELPDLSLLTARLHTVPVIADTTYLDYVFQVDVAVDAFDATIGWSRLAKPWFDVWLTDREVERYVTSVVPELTRDDVGSSGFVLVFATRRDLATRPNVVLPTPDGSRWVFLFDILTSSDTTDPGEAWKAAMLARNDRLFARARDHHGGVRYPIGTLTFTDGDWRAHYGERWPTVLALKAKYDPAGILGTGVGIFGS